ncbi:hypothetical protein ACJX0J_010539, partial [Zea mays]
MNTGMKNFSMILERKIKTQEIKELNKALGHHMLLALAVVNLLQRVFRALVTSGARKSKYILNLNFRYIMGKLRVRGETVDTELNLRRRGASYSILFYAAWCPFSSKLRPIFGTLSTMYPQIHHFTVEESSATPSLFSRYGVRGFPAILLVNETTMVRYRGSKDLNSLVDFYKETTGLDPIAYIDVVEQESTGSLSSVMPWDRSIREMAKDEMYLLVAVLFIIVK